MEYAYTFVDFKWRRLFLRARALLADARNAEVMQVLREDKEKVTRASCWHDPSFGTGRGNAHYKAILCDPKKGGCGALLDYVNFRKQLHGTTSSKTAASAVSMEERARRLVKGEDVPPQQKPMCQRCENQMLPFRTTYGQTVLTCSQWFSPNRCRVLNPLPGEVLERGKPAAASAAAAPSSSAQSGAGVAVSAAPPPTMPKQLQKAC